MWWFATTSAAAPFHAPAITLAGAARVLGPLITRRARAESTADATRAAVPTLLLPELAANAAPAAAVLRAVPDPRPSRSRPYLI
ncbi:hypothetical protein L6164_000362 [Bauhinia variegata]|uniref:Uncharacterized protein n=1 Tax=Bauhinia variegata TaxID=167791 RepID=A0ACB9Q698_BAUVA|nr:hypothetical protein L6164_000362 [Bauhinia variegata]